MSEKQLRTVLREIADVRIPPESVDLWPRVRRGLDELRVDRRRPASGRAMKAALPVFIILVLLTISLVVVGPERALAALRGLVGYIPGVGIVDQDTSMHRPCRFDLVTGHTSSIGHGRAEAPHELACIGRQAVHISVTRSEDDGAEVVRRG